MDSKGKSLPTLAPRGPDVVASAPVPAPLPKKNSVACLPCKQAKRKCSGRPAPCQACQNTETECIFDPTLDSRRKAARKRIVDERDYFRAILSSLLNVLRTSEPDRVDELLSFIRSDSSIGDALTALAQPEFNLSKLGPLDAITSSGVEKALLSLCPSSGLKRKSSTQMRADSSVDGPLLQVPAKPWTDVTDDDELVSHLVTLYFTWSHPCLQVLEEAIFRSHMNAGYLDSAYCTPFLVNCILALATVYSDSPDIFITPGRAVSGRSYFLAEAERLWKAEEGTASLTNVQGLLIMCDILRVQGKVTLGWLVLRQAVQLAQDLGMFHTPLILHSDLGMMSPDMQRVRAITAWGVFITNTDMSIVLRKNANLDLPISRPYTEDDLLDGAVWAPYPRLNQAQYGQQPALLRYVGIEMANLAEITINIIGLSFRQITGMGIDSLWNATNELHVRLVKWYEDLPAVLHVDGYPAPHVVFLHIKYYEGIISMFTPFLENPGSENILHAPWSEHAKETRVLAAQEIAQCFHTLRQSYGYEQMPSPMLEAANTALLVVVGGLTRGGSENACVELSRVFSASSKRFKQARDMIEKILSFAQQSGIALPPQVASILNQ